ncbi:hypothetical protein AB0910_17325 [Streptomyces sp. NPDC047002]|uniref:hypothetical protein n=1 Tax=Streptomyces sp. NPDC047002 TaxID=3155475 RepID=UPI0034512E7B
MTVTLMWEAKAAEGRGAELLTWARAQRQDAEPLRRETFRAPGDRVLVLTWWPGTYDTAVPELPEPPDGLVARPVHRWRFEPVDEPGTGGATGA